MELVLVGLFFCGYVAISIEHQLKLDKAAIALFVAFLLWTVIALFGNFHHEIHQILSEHLSSIAEIVFFLMGAMAIVEVIDSHQGFRIITDRIRTRNKRKLLLILSLTTFFLSAVLDNLATTIVMMAIMLKFVSSAKDKTIFTGVIVIAANAGGAFSPIGDITTTMLWIGGQVSPFGIMAHTFLPSLAAFLLPLIVAMLMIDNEILPSHPRITDSAIVENPKIDTVQKVLVFVVGIGFLIAVPIFKLVTGLPPFMGILGALGVLWVLTELLHREGRGELTKHLTVSSALKEIDLSSILFFVGILLAVAALEVSGTLGRLATLLDSSIPNLNIIPIVLGLFSAVFDNVPLVAASMQMYPLERIPTDSSFWYFLAYAAGTGGSVLIIGSAAGVTAMGITKVSFGAYALRVGPLALIGYFSGILIFYIQTGLRL